MEFLLWKESVVKTEIFVENNSLEPRKIKVFLQNENYTKRYFFHGIIHIEVNNSRQ